MILTAGDAQLEVALLGATPVRWLVDLGDVRWDLLDGYRDEAELWSQDGVRNGVMAPFCNRIAGGRYAFDGVEHDLSQGCRGAIYHGLTRTLPFSAGPVEQRDDGVRLTLRCTALRGQAVPGYPFDVDVDVEYDLTPTRLAARISGVNRGDRAAPFAAGWHPYFRLPGASSIDRLHLSVPSRIQVRTGPDLVPRDGPTAFHRLVPDARWSPIGDAVLDAAYADLSADGSGTSRSVLTDPETGVELVLSQHGGLVHVFTGDTLARDRRASIAVEPVEVMTDAFNRPDCAAAIRLEPGEHRTFAFEVEVRRSDPHPDGRAIAVR